MPNLKGGSGYKRKKKGGGDDDVIVIADMEEGQMFARVVKVLGNCNMLVYSEDGRERLCHIRGKMRSRMFVHVGDIVIISTRGFEKVEPGRIQRGDICHKYDSKHLSALRKKFPDVNPVIFTNVDTGAGKKSDETGFEFEGGAEDAGEEGSGDEDSDDENEVVVPGEESAPQGQLGGSRKRPVDLIVNEDGDVDIDAI